jgi:2-polyprenyl-3-methyl-5-hydroxy-6-metoxy-1,4-benzoquinol methylase
MACNIQLQSDRAEKDEGTMKSTDVIDIYDSDYFLKAVDGYVEFSCFDGSIASLFSRYQRNIQMLGLLPHHKLLEFGCGRGEVCIYHALQGGEAKGVDFSGDAIKLARDKAASLNAQVDFVETSFDALNELPETYDRILASEFIEHISRQEGELFFKKAFSLLKPGGKLLIYTFPNTLHRRYGYQIRRIWSALHGRIVPKLQDDMLSEHYKLYHLNEQSYFSLNSSAVAAGFNRIVVGYDMGESERKSFFKQMIHWIIVTTPLRHLFFRNLFVLAEK